MAEDPFNPMPALSAHHLVDAKLFATREDMVSDLCQRGAETICEVGVAFGDFSEVMIRRFSPKIFIAVDLFDLHRQEIIWGKRTTELLNGRQHLDYYLGRIGPLVRHLHTLVGSSIDEFPKVADQSCDLIYIDGGHDYETVKHDAEVALRKVKTGGVVIFNDYTLYDPFGCTAYGVVRVVNELLTTSNWRMVGFALQPHMFCDVAIRQIAAG